MKHAFSEKTELVYRATRYFCLGKESKALGLVDEHHLMVTPFLEIHECPEILKYEGTFTVLNPRYYGVFKMSSNIPTSKIDGICLFNISELFNFSKLCEIKLKNFCPNR
jgi:hypothetical protein